MGNRSCWVHYCYMGHRKHSIRIRWSEILLEFNEPHVNDMHRASPYNPSRHGVILASLMRPTQVRHIHPNLCAILESRLVCHRICLHSPDIIHHLRHLSSGEKLVAPTGFEPVLLASRTSVSFQLDYGAICLCNSVTPVNPLEPLYPSV